MKTYETINRERERREKNWEWLLVYSLPLSSSSSPSYRFLIAYSLLSPPIYPSPTSSRAPEKSSPTSRTSKTRRPLPREMSHIPHSLSLHSLSPTSREEHFCPLLSQEVIAHPFINS
ncbi:hypothetical protein YC2023_045546 [Brassica napus]